MRIAAAVSTIPKDLAGVEMYPRASSAPIQYQQVATGCGVVLVWTKYLK